MGIEYSGAIGTMLMDKLADVNKSIHNHVEVVSDQAQEALRSTEDLDERLEAEKARADVLEERVVYLEQEQEVLHGDIRRLEEDSEDCWIMLAEVWGVIQEFWAFWASLQHGPRNPIVVVKFSGSEWGCGDGEPLNCWFTCCPSRLVGGQ